MEKLQSQFKLGEVIPNIATFLDRNLEMFANNIAYQEKDASGEYVGINWTNLYDNIQRVAYNLKEAGFQKGEKIVIFSPNRLEMLELELAVMAYGGIAVPIFAAFKKDTAELLINHSQSTWLAVAGQKQLDQLGDELNLRKIFFFDEVNDTRFNNIVPFSTLLKEIPSNNSCFDYGLEPESICLNMYTSGTMGTPKCVQLMHKNILSQQAALDIVWDVNENDRFLAYLPWHHSFGGIFELFTALYNGATYSLESSLGKKPESIFENWEKIKPTIFFSVPKVYQSLIDLTQSSKEAENTFFNSGLKFIFTAAAPLPENLSNEFEKRNIPVIEGWGLTETSPCCTLTDPSLKRASGVVGLPIPGVEVRIGEEDEIQVKGPNIMTCYFDNDEANKDVFTEDGWYRTGDVGAITETGLKLIARKDRIFKLSNGEKVIPTDLEKIIEKKCHYVQYIIISGSGEDYPVALIFPNRNLLENPNQARKLNSTCACPNSVDAFGDCLFKCLNEANDCVGQKFSKIKYAALINDDLSLDDKTLTPSMKVAPKNVIAKYKEHLKNLYGNDVPTDEEVFIVRLDNQKVNS